MKGFYLCNASIVVMLDWFINKCASKTKSLVKTSESRNDEKQLTFLILILEI